MPDNEETPRYNLRQTASRKERAERQAKQAAVHVPARPARPRRNARKRTAAEFSAGDSTAAQHTVRTDGEQSMDMDAPQADVHPTAAIEAGSADGAPLDVATRPAQNQVDVHPTAAIEGASADGAPLDVAIRPAQNEVAGRRNAAPATDPKEIPQGSIPMGALGQAIDMRIQQAGQAFGQQVEQFVEQSVGKAETNVDRKLVAVAPLFAEHVDQNAKIIEANTRRMVDEILNLIIDNFGEFRNDIYLTRDELITTQNFVEQNRSAFNDGLEQSRALVSAAQDDILQTRETFGAALGESIGRLDKLFSQQEAVDRRLTELEHAQDASRQAQGESNNARSETSRDRVELRAARDKLNQGRTELDTARDEISRNLGELAAARDDYNRGRTQLIAVQSELNERRSEIEAARDEFNKVLESVQDGFIRSLEELGAARIELNESRDAWDTDRDQLNRDRSEFGTALARIDETLDGMNAAGPEFKEVRDELNRTRANESQLLEERVKVQLAAMTERFDAQLAAMSGRVNAQLTAMTERVNALQISGTGRAPQPQTLRESNANGVERNVAEPASRTVERRAAPAPDVAAPVDEGVRLAVPLTDLPAARAQGAWWEEEKGWMAPVSADLRKFAKWVPLSSYFANMENMPIALPSKTDAPTKLAVPFDERERAKNLGARWNQSERTWMLPKGKDLNKVKEWVPLSYYTSDLESILQAPLPDRLEAPVTLAVPLGKGHIAHGQGAQLDRNTGRWNVPAGVDLRKLGKWVPLSYYIAGREGEPITLDAPVTLAVTHQEAKAAETAGAKRGAEATEWIAEPGAKLNKLAQWVSSSAYLDGRVAERMARDHEAHSEPARGLEHRSGRDRTRGRV